MSNLDLRALEIFRAVVVEGSVSKAATKLNRVQSNISTRIKQLEQQLGKTLFLRQNRGLTLTSDGELLLSYAERLIELSEEASNALNDGEPKGVFRIGAMESTAAARLPAILNKYTEQYSKVQIQLVTGTAGALTKQLLKNEIEIAFIAEPLIHEQLTTKSVFEEKLILIAPKSYPPLNHVCEVNHKTIIAFEEGCAYRQYLEGWLRDTNIVPGSILSVSSYLAIFACVSAGTGFAIAPQSVLDMVSTHNSFSRYPLPGNLSQIKTMMAWRTNYKSAKLDALKALLPGMT
ncbi:MAG: LysR substrate-binding domain-containing protein [Sneathiella sp.]